MKIIHFADLHLGVENYGHINPESGLSSRVEDYLKAFDQVIDFALQTQADLVLFCGDAYKTREPSQTHQREFAKRIKRLSSGGIPLFLLIGNHDLPNAMGRATAIEIFETLSVPGVHIANRPGLHRIKTNSGDIQIAALPWVRRSALLSRENTRNLSFSQINERLQMVLTGIIREMASQIDRSIPAVLAAHVWVLNAKIGSEKSMSIGQEHMLLLGNVANPIFDYVALGHIHKGQILSEYPPVVYSGSLERLDFGDEKDEKGYYLVDIEEEGGQRKVTWSFHPIDARRFFTLSVDIEPLDNDPTATLLKKIEINQDKIRDAVVRLEISIPSIISNKLRDEEVRNKVKDAYYLTIAKEIKRESRLRLEKGALEGVSPLDALKAYLTSKYPSERAKTLLEYGEKLIKDES